MIFDYLILFCLIVLLYFIFKLRKRVKHLEEYYKDVKLDNSIIKAKIVQASRQLDIKNITK